MSKKKSVTTPQDWSQDDHVTWTGTVDFNTTAFKQFCGMYEGLLRFEELKTVWVAANQVLDHAVNIAEPLIWQVPSLAASSVCVPSVASHLSNLQRSVSAPLEFISERDQGDDLSTTSTPVSPRISQEHKLRAAVSGLGNDAMQVDRSPAPCKPLNWANMLRNSKPKKGKLHGKTCASSRTDKEDALLNTGMDVWEFPTLTETVSSGVTGSTNKACRSNFNALLSAEEQQSAPLRPPSSCKSAWLPLERPSTAVPEGLQYNRLTEKKANFLCWCFPALQPEVVDFVLMACGLKLHNALVLLLEDYAAYLNMGLQQRIKIAAAASVPRRLATLDSKQHAYPWNAATRCSAFLAELQNILKKVFSSNRPDTTDPTCNARIKDSVLKWVSQELQQCFPKLDQEIIKEVVNSHYRERANVVEIFADLNNVPLSQHHPVVHDVVDLIQSSWVSLFDINLDTPMSVLESVELQTANEKWAEIEQHRIAVDTILRAFDPTGNWNGDDSGKKACSSAEAPLLHKEAMMCANSKNAPDFSIPLLLTPFTSHPVATGDVRCYSLQAPYYALLRLRNVHLRNAASASACRAWGDALRSSSEGRALELKAQRVRRRAAETIFKLHNPGCTTVYNNSSDTTSDSEDRIIFVPTLSFISDSSKNQPGRKEVRNGYFAVVDLHLLYVDEALTFLQDTLNYLVDHVNQLPLKESLSDAYGKDSGWMPLFVHVVTGRGTHSRKCRGLSRLQQAVQTMLQSQRKFRWRPGQPGVFLIRVI